MELSWEERKVSTVEEIFAKIKTEMPQPVGIVIFGVDDNLREKTVEMVKHELSGFSGPVLHLSKMAEITRFRMALKNQGVVTLTMDSRESRRSDLLDEAIKKMRKAGVKSLIGCYAKVEESTIRSARRSITLQARMRALQDAQAMENSHPDRHDFDKFYEVTEQHAEISLH